MIFIVHSPPPPDVRSVLVRRNPKDPRVLDYFCVADITDVAPLHDGWYADDTGGGIAVWGSGRYWEVRSTPFTILLSDTDLYHRT
jgi:hypothetical protein